MRCTERAYAKINLTLDVGAKRADGYHEITSVMQRISLWDTVTVECGTGCDSLLCSVPVTEDVNDNLCMKALRVFFTETAMESGGVSITLEKHIPTQAGLGGGSSDAAAVLLAIGRGEIVTPLLPLTAGWFVVVKPEESYSTAEMYRRLDACGGMTAEDSRMEDAVAGNNVHAIAAELRNSFERAVPEDSRLWDIKAALRAQGALGTLLSGSGSAVFGVFDDRKEAAAAAMTLRRTWPQVFLTQPV